MFDFQRWPQLCQAASSLARLQQRLPERRRRGLSSALVSDDTLESGVQGLAGAGPRARGQRYRRPMAADHAEHLVVLSSG